MDSALLRVSETIVGFYRALDLHPEPAEQLFAPDEAESGHLVTVYEGLIEAPMRLMSVLHAHDELARIEGACKLAHKHSRRHLPFNPA
jgi:hypothetical protein